MAYRIALILVVLIGIGQSASAVASDDLEQGFANPPDAAKPWA